MIRILRSQAETVVYYPPSVRLGDVYQGYTELVAPKGWKFIGIFRPPQFGEFYLGEDGTVEYASTMYGNYRPHLILDKVERKQYMFTETGEVRVPEKGEWFLFMEYPTKCLNVMEGKYPILTLKMSTCGQSEEK